MQIDKSVGRGETLEWQPLRRGTNDSCLFWAKDEKNIFFAGGGMKEGKLQVNLADVIEVSRKV